ncbi:hypothetical protein [Tenacibaculum aiptasiae]|uniref:hypothetical protein n=1 Tax=Tenacibaculum aiptasiae TaxID=426481 RepID=UPI003B5A6A5B
MIKIEHKDLSRIAQIYSDKIKEKFLERIEISLEIIKFLNKKEEIQDSDIAKVQGRIPALKAVADLEKIYKSKHKGGTGKDKEDLIYSLNKLGVRVDKRSKCRRGNKYATVEYQLKEIERFVNENDLFVSQPKELLIFNNKLANKFKDSKSLKTKLYNYLFDYNVYRELLNTYIGQALGLKCCPYCNRNYITYVNKENNKRLIGATYDHFFYKKKYKYLTLSFYNLIPSCYICNSNLKRDIDFKIENHIHPYIEGFDSNAVFDFDLSSSLDSKKICFEPKLIAKEPIKEEDRKKIFGVEEEKASGSVNVFKLQEIYKSHGDSVEEIHEKFDENSKYYVGTISDIISILRTSEEEFYRFHFRNYFNKTDFHRRPLSKLNRDIYDKMKRILELTI